MFSTASACALRERLDEFYLYKFFRFISVFDKDSCYVYEYVQFSPFLFFRHFIDEVFFALSSHFTMDSVFIITMFGLICFCFRHFQHCVHTTQTWIYTWNQYTWRFLFVSANVTHDWLFWPKKYIWNSNSNRQFEMLELVPEHTAV